MSSRAVASSPITTIKSFCTSKICSEMEAFPENSRAIRGAHYSTFRHFICCVLPDGRLRLGFLHDRRINLFAKFDKLDLAVLRKSGACRNQMAHDDIFLKSAKTIDFAKCRRLGEHAGCILERGSRDKAIGFERSFRDPEKHRRGFGRLSTLLNHALILCFKIESIDLIAPKQRSIAGIGDLYFAQRLAHDDLDVFVVDLHAL